MMSDIIGSLALVLNLILIPPFGMPGMALRLLHSSEQEDVKFVVLKVTAICAATVVIGMTITIAQYIGDNLSF